MTKYLHKAKNYMHKRCLLFENFTELFRTFPYAGLHKKDIDMVAVTPVCMLSNVKVTSHLIKYIAFCVKLKMRSVFYGYSLDIEAIYQK